MADSQAEDFDVDATLAELIEKGWVELIVSEKPGPMRYRITPEGIKHVEGNLLKRPAGYKPAGPSEE